MSRGWRIFWIASTIIVVPGGIWGGIGLYALSQICYQIAGFELMSIDDETVFFKLGIRIFNPSFLSVDIKSYDLIIYLNNSPVARLKKDSPNTISAKGKSILTIPVVVKYKNTLDRDKKQELFTNFITHQYDKIVLKVKGKFHGRLMKIPISKDIDFDYTVADIIKIMKEPDAPCPAIDNKKAA